MTDDDTNTTPPATADPVPGTPAAEAPPAAAAEVGEDLAPESAGNPPQPEDEQGGAAVVPGDGVPGDGSAEAGEQAVTPEAADAAGAAAGDGIDVPGDDEDHLPAGQTALAVGDEVVVDDDTMRRALEAILMVTDEPLPVLTLARAVGRNTGDIAEALAGLAAEYTAQGRGFDLREVGGGWRYYTRPEAAKYVERFVLDGQQARLTQAALETLAVVAYKQPVSRARVSAIRGVNVDGVMRTLVARGLVEEAGADTESQATLYRTTTYFLERMGMQSLDDLPELAPYLPEMDDIEEELAAQTLPPAEAEPEQPATEADTDTTTPDAEETDEHGEQAAADADLEADDEAAVDESAEDVDEFGQSVAEGGVSSADGSGQPAVAVDADDTDQAGDADDADQAGDAEDADHPEDAGDADHADHANDPEDPGDLDDAEDAEDADHLDHAEDAGGSSGAEDGERVGGVERVDGVRYGG